MAVAQRYWLDGLIEREAFLILTRCKLKLGTPDYGLRSIYPNGSSVRRMAGFGRFKYDSGDAHTYKDGFRAYSRLLVRIRHCVRYTEPCHRESCSLTFCNASSGANCDPHSCTFAFEHESDARAADRRRSL